MEFIGWKFRSKMKPRWSALLQKVMLYEFVAKKPDNGILNGSSNKTRSVLIANQGVIASSSGDVWT